MSFPAGTIPGLTVWAIWLRFRSPKGVGQFVISNRCLFSMRVTGNGLLSTRRAQRPQPSLSRNGAVALSIRIVGAAGMLLCHVILARSLGVTGFGEYAQAIAWMQVLCVFGKAGLDNAS